MTTYYVDVTTGDNSDTGLTEALAWADLGYAANQVAAGDLVYVKNTASYVVADPDTATCVFEITTAGSVSTPIVWEGYTTTPGDGGVAIVDANTNTLANACLSTLGPMYNVFKSMRFTGGSGIGFSATDGDGNKYVDCRFDNNDGGGVIVDNYSFFINCLADNNGGDGFESDTGVDYIGCISHTNSGDGFTTENAFLVFCQSYNNGANNAIAMGSWGAGGSIVNCIVDGDNNGSSTGIYTLSTAGWVVLINNIIFDCNVGANGAAAAGQERLFARNNLFYSNTTDRTNFPVGDDDVAGTEDPFTDSAGRDYSLKTDSEAEDAGYDGADAVTFWGL